VAEPRFTPKARQDLNDIRDFSAERWGRDQADRYVVTIVGVCQGLVMGRLTGREAGTVREGYATYRTGSHIVFFRRVDDGGSGIEIVRSDRFARHGGHISLPTASSSKSLIRSQL
jgi:toxin ParE1/3/4